MTNDYTENSNLASDGLVSLIYFVAYIGIDFVSRGDELS